MTAIRIVVYFREEGRHTHMRIFCGKDAWRGKAGDLSMANEEFAVFRERAEGTASGGVVEFIEESERVAMTEDCRMNRYRVVVFDEYDQVLISKVITATATKEIVADCARAIISTRNAPFTVSVTDYTDNTANASEFMEYLDSALKEMSLRGED